MTTMPAPLVLLRKAIDEIERIAPSRELAERLVQTSALALSKAESIEEVKEIHDKLHALESLFRRQRAELTSSNLITAQRLQTERMIGRYLEENGRQQGDAERYEKSSDSTFHKLADLGFSKYLSSQWKRIADIDDEDFKIWLEDGIRGKYELSTESALGLWRETVEPEEKKRDMERRVANLPKVSLPDRVRLIVGDFRNEILNLNDESVDLVFTDPPYGREAIPLYRDLAHESARVLKPGGSLICYVGHYAIPEVVGLMVPHLRYWWMLCCKHNGNSARLTGVNVFVEWKPMLWFVKERRGGNTDFVSDLVESSQPTKDEHDWQQSEAEALYYIAHLTHPGDTVLDPFAGSGTTLIAAHKLDRISIGIEINEQSAEIAKVRIATATKN